MDEKQMEAFSQIMKSHLKLPTQMRNQTYPAAFTMEEKILIEKHSN